jgi:hypothetical protein
MEAFQEYCRQRMLEEQVLAHTSPDRVSQELHLTSAQVYQMRLLLLQQQASRSVC